MITKYLSISTFLISLSIGLLMVYMWGADMNEVYVFPTPENMMRFNTKINQITVMYTKAKKPNVHQTKQKYRNTLFSVKI